MACKRDFAALQGLWLYCTVTLPGFQHLYACYLHYRSKVNQQA